jgi:large subunit ribosomal protein L25
MSDDFVLNAQLRTDLGKGASRRLRRNDSLMPGVVYGGNADPVSISIQHKDIHKASQNEAFYSHIISLVVDGKAEDVIIKDLQRHPAKDILLHADFLRISGDVKITVNVPLHFINEDTCVGVKMGGGSIQHSATEVEVSCLPKDLPEFIEVDMAEAELGAHLHQSDLKLPEGVTSVALSHGADHDLPVASVNAPKGGAKDDDGEEAAAEGDSEE